MKKTCLLTIVFLLVVSSSLVVAQTPANQYLIELAGKGPKDLEGAIEAAGGRLVHDLSGIGAVSAVSEDEAFADILAGVGGFKSITRDYQVQWLPSATDVEEMGGPVVGEGHATDPNLAFFRPCQWNLDQINAAGAWAQGEFGAGTTVAVLDTGVSGDPLWGGGAHVDMQGQVVGNVTMLSSPSICDTVVPDMATPLDFRFHGTFVAGQIAARGFGIAGVAPDAKIYGVKVLNCLGSGTFGDLIAGILHAANTPFVDVINMSLGAYFPKNLPGAGPLVAAMDKAVNYAQAVKGKLVVSAAGNSGANLDHDSNFVAVPAQSGSGVSAWAGDFFGGLASYSNHGVSGTDVGAGGGDGTPGVFIPACALPVSGHDGIVSVCSVDSIFFGCGFGSFLFGGSGTSFAAPVVAGVGALAKGKNPSKNGNQLKATLKNTADDLGKKGADNLFSKGRVNANKAVQ